MRHSHRQFRKGVVSCTPLTGAATWDETPPADSEHAAASMSALHRNRGRWPRNDDAPRPARAARHFLFNGPGWSDVVLSFVEPGVGYHEDEQASVA